MPWWPRTSFETFRTAWASSLVTVPSAVALLTSALIFVMPASNFARSSFACSCLAASHSGYCVLDDRGIKCEFDEERKVLKPTPLHDWTSHAADAFRYMSMGWKEARGEAPAPKSAVDFFIGTEAGTIASNLSIKEMIERQSKRRKERAGA